MGQEIVAGGLRNHKRRKQLGKRERLGRAERGIWERSKREKINEGSGCKELWSLEGGKKCDKLLIPCTAIML